VEKVSATAKGFLNPAVGGRAAIEAVSTWRMSTLQLQVRWLRAIDVPVKLSNQAEASKMR